MNWIDWYGVLLGCVKKGGSFFVGLFSFVDYCSSWFLFICVSPPVGRQMRWLSQLLFLRLSLFPLHTSVLVLVSSVYWFFEK